MVPDARLVSEAVRGNASAFAELVRRHERSMLALAYACTRCGTTSADVVQEAYIRVWKRLGDLREPDKFVPWLAQTVRRLSTNALRSPSRRLKLVGDESLDANSGVNDTDQLEREDTARLIDKAIATLDETTASCVMLRYYQDLSSKEIGAMLDLSPAAVDMRLSRARATLKTALASHVQEDVPRSRSVDEEGSHARVG